LQPAWRLWCEKFLRHLLQPPAKRVGAEHGQQHNDRFDEFRVTFGSLLKCGDKWRHARSPAWRPSGIRSMEAR